MKKVKQLFNTIYILRNVLNNKIYIGQTWWSLKDRWNNGFGYLGCKKLNSAIKKYGKENFYYEILTFCSTQEVADYYEIFFIKMYNSIANGYNIAIGGESVMLGRKHSEESLAKMSESHKGNTAHLGKNHSDETKEILRKSSLGNQNSLGHFHSEETKNKISKSQLLKEKNGNSGSFKSGENDVRCRNRLGKTWKLIDGKRIWSNK